MAEILCAVAPPPQNGYEDCDVLVACNDHHIQLVHAWHQCFPRDETGKKPSDVNGLRLDPLGLGELACERTYRYRYERTGPQEITRTDLTTSGVDVITPSTPAPDGWWVNDVQALVDHFLDSNRLPGRTTGKFIVGSLGAERWWAHGRGAGGKRAQAAGDLDDIWTAVESVTSVRRVNSRMWPWTPRELRSHLALSVDDFTPEVSTQLTESEIVDLSWSRVVTSVSSTRISWQWGVTFDQDPSLWRPRARRGDIMRDAAGTRCKVAFDPTGPTMVLSVIPPGLAPVPGTANFESTRIPKLRKCKGLWRSLGLNVSEIEDRARVVDVRNIDAPFARSVVIEQKPTTSDEDL